LTQHYLDQQTGYYTSALTKLSQGTLQSPNPVAPYLASNAALPDFTNYYAMDIDTDSLAKAKTKPVVVPTPSDNNNTYPTNNNNDAYAYITSSVLNRFFSFLRFTLGFDSTASGNDSGVWIVAAFSVCVVFTITIYVYRHRVKEVIQQASSVTTKPAVLTSSPVVASVPTPPVAVPSPSPFTLPIQTIK
jgi:hypothetical protein